MSINLQEIRTAVINYIDTKVTVSISALVPATGSTIGPNEEFSFTLTARNATTAEGGIALKNVVWRVWLENETVGKLIVPPTATAMARSSLSDTTSLTPGNYVKEMYLFPPNIIYLPPLDANTYLGAGDTDTLSLKGKAGATPTGGTTNIRFKIYADVDLDWLFPKNQDSSTAAKVLLVEG